MKFFDRMVVLAGWTLVALLSATDASAQTFPNRLVRVIVPFPPAGEVDIVARVIGQKLGEKWKHGVIVENRPGASTVIGTDLVAKSAPDGHTILLAVTAHAVNATLFEKLPFDPIKDFAPISLIATAPNILLVHPSVPVNSVMELVQLAKANPGKLNFASPGSGTAMHLSGELFKQAAGAEIVHVPYKGTQPALTALVAGDVSLAFSTGVSMPFVKAGKLRALAVTTSRRAAAMPELPTMAEAGLGGFEAASWYGFLAPAGTPAEIVEILNREINEALRDPDVRERIMRIGLELLGTSATAFEQHLKSEVAKWGKVVRQSGAKPG
ncbi:MAG: hypothetical protein A3H97_13335 [Acidobacteria bacterium RIFCSPLOWO2_02_FULL_65_29]|nr:MAG: hypothetical protein A3H97_13335 [Acidobacteria bacterium RIFCSPLOWO2_02_FULL_65_29]